MSAVLHLTYGETSFIFAGDAGKQSEAEILKSGTPIKADILKVGHHGSKSSSGESFIKAVSPKYAIISVGENSYGHPASEVLGTLNRYGVNIYRTDEAGTIIVESDGENITINRNSTVIQPNAPPVTKAEFSEEQMVYITDTGKRYHLPECRHLYKSKHEIPLSEAKARYEACSACKPP